ncbi:MAG: glycosyltransferase [Actinomycetota bacterium]
MKIVVVAYACEPGKGSEPGAGWGWVRMIARMHETYVITRSNNRDVIEAALERLPEESNLHFVYTDLPPWARSWKRGMRGMRLYSLLWQVGAAIAVRKLQREQGVQLVWHLTIANAALGSIIPLGGGPFVYGPVGGTLGPPAGLLTSLGWRGIAVEIARAVIRTVGRTVNPFARVAWSQASLILVQNHETRQWLPRRHRGKTIVLQHAILEEAPHEGRAAGRSPSRAVFVGRLIAWKGAHLAVQTVAKTKGWHLLVCGSGPEEQRLEQIVRGLGIEDRVRLLGQQSRDEVLRLMQQEADVLLFPSLHDDAPLAVVEALACSLPVVCIDRGGPPILVGDAGIAVQPTSVEQVIEDLAAALDSASTLRRHARERGLEFTLARRLETVRRVLSEAAERGLVTAEFAVPADLPTPLPAADGRRDVPVEGN